MLFVAIPKPHAEGSNSSVPAIGIFRRQDVFAYNRTSLQNGPVVQLVRTLACHARGRRFEPVPGRHFFASVAQSVEQGTENPRVDGSIPSGGTKNADVAHLVERHLAKVEVAGSSPVIRSKKH